MKLLASLLVIAFQVSAWADVKPKNAVIGNPCGVPAEDKAVEFCLGAPRGQAGKELYLVYHVDKDETVLVHLRQRETDIKPTVQHVYDGAAAFKTEFGRSYPIHHAFVVSVDNADPKRQRLHIAIDNGTEKKTFNWFALEERAETKSLE